MADITFVDEIDVVIGSGTKHDAWKKGIAHRIVRVFVFNQKGEVLIQKRADTCMSLPGKWDQSAAGYVDANERYHEAAERELREEVGVSGVTLGEVAKYYTEETDELDKVKKRFNMLYAAEYDGEITSDPSEVSESRWVTPDELEWWMAEKPDDFTGGFIDAFKRLRERTIIV